MYDASSTGSFFANGVGVVLPLSLGIVQVGVVHQVVNLVWFKTTFFQTCKHTLRHDQVSYRLSSEKRVKLFGPHLEHTFKVFNRTVHDSSENVRTFCLPSILTPLFLNFSESSEVYRSATHRTPRARAFEVPALYTPRTKLVSTAQFAARSGFVAHSTLHGWLNSLVRTTLDSYTTCFLVIGEFHPEYKLAIRGGQPL